MILPVKNFDLQEIVTKTNEFFGKNTPLSKTETFGDRKYEERPQQREMAEEIANAFIFKSNLCIEAPTGVGKSFAYLVPAIYLSKKKKIPVVISTETINLQEQLINKDIPILQNLLDIQFSAVIAKGRSNYLCKRRLDLVFGEYQGDYLPSNTLMPEFVKLQEWAMETKDGTLSEISFDPSQTWSHVCCEAYNCLGPKCKYIKNCFYWKARRERDKADIIVANHALFLTDLKVSPEEEAGKSLPPYGAVVMDESHQLESNAAKYLGVRISEIQVYNTLQRLFNPKNSRGLLIRPGEKAIELRQIVTDLLTHCKLFFDSARDYMFKLGDLDEKRVLQKHIFEDLVTGQFALLERKLYSYIESIEDEEYKLEINSQYQKSKEFTKCVFEFLEMQAEESVYWIEQQNSSSAKSISLNYSPLNISAILKEKLFNIGIPIVLTSATLSVSNKLDFYKKRTGFDGMEKLLSSPFNFKEQAKIYIPKRIKDPTEQGFEEDLAEHIKKYISYTHGKAFILFTSYSLLNKMKGLTSNFFIEKGIQLLSQGDGISRSKMIKIFKEDIDSVIFGTTSFWTGVDIPGEALSNVIITKLPFSVPSEPLIEARLEKIQKEGKNPFMEYSLPEAVLKLKQGIGRLIRSKQDRGIIVILDNRVITKRYGKMFLDSLPNCQIIIE